MTNLSQIIFDRYQIRRTKAQKQAFLDLMCEHYPQAKIEEDESARNRNLVIGDAQNAEVIVGAHYDTCAHMFFPNFLTPKNIPIYILFNLAVALVFAGIAIGVIVGIQSLIAHEILHFVQNDMLITIFVRAHDSVRPCRHFVWADRVVRPYGFTVYEQTDKSKFIGLLQKAPFPRDP